MALSSIIESLGANSDTRAVQLGHIKIGSLGAARDKSGGNGSWRPPVKDDHFTIRTMHRAQNGDLIIDDVLMKKLAVAFGDPKDGKLRQIPIRVLSNDIDDVLQSAWCWYGGKVCGGRSDGKKITWFVNPQNPRERYDPPIEQPWNEGDEKNWLDSKQKPMFKLHSIFNCVIAAEDARWGGVYKFRTTSLVSFKQLYASLLHIHQLTGGILVGMPLMLVVRPIQVSPDGKATTVHVVHVELRGSEMRQIQQQAMQQQQWMIENKQKMLTMQAQYRKLLVGPGSEPQSEAGDVAEEFQPEAQEIEPAPAKFDLIDGSPESDDSAVEAVNEAAIGATETPQAEDLAVRQDSPGQPVGIHPFQDLHDSGREAWEKALVEKAKLLTPSLGLRVARQALEKFAVAKGVGAVEKLTVAQLAEAIQTAGEHGVDMLNGVIKGLQPSDLSIAQRVRQRHAARPEPSRELDPVGTINPDEIPY